MSERETSCLRVWRQLVLCGFWSGGYRSCWTGSSWSSGLWPMWWRSRVALAKREGESSMWSRKYRAYSLPCSTASVNQWTADSLSCGMYLPIRYSLPRAYWAQSSPVSAALSITSSVEGYSQTGMRVLTSAGPPGIAVAVLEDRSHGLLPAQRSAVYGQFPQEPALPLDDHQAE